MSSQSQPSSSRSQSEIDTIIGYAAIDFGSTSTRAYLGTFDKQTKHVGGFRVQKTGVDDNHKKRFLRGEWPSKGCPFDAPYPVGYDAEGIEHADKRHHSLKSILWFLARDDDNHRYTRDLKKYNESLSGVQEKEKFRERLTNMLVEHLSIVAEQICAEARIRQIPICRLVFCVPNAWDKKNFQDVLRPIMDKVAEVIGEIETYCVFESEALSQFIIRQHRYLLKDRDFVLVCDFGGHFMGGSLFQFSRKDAGDAKPAFFSLPQGNFGIRGGSQLWEDHICPYIDDYVDTQHLPADRASVLRSKFRDAFFFNQNEVNASFYEKKMSLRLAVDITDAFPDDTEPHRLSLEPGDIWKAWELGFKESINLALKNIKQSIPAPCRDRAIVILSGGSMQNYHARTEIKQACKKYGIQCEVVGFDVNVESSKWMVCEGAAKSEAGAMIPQDFFQRGAAIAVQSYPKSGTPEINAPVLFYGCQQATLGSPVEVELGGKKDRNIRLVCDPMYQRNLDRKRYTTGNISIRSDDTASTNNNCYDIWDVSRKFEQMHPKGFRTEMRIPDGSYLIQAKGIKYDEDGIDATLHLQLTRRSVKEARPASTGRDLRARTVTASQMTYSFDLPLTSLGSSNLVVLDHDKVENRLWKPRSALAGLPQSVPEQESVGDRRSRTKRQRIEVTTADEQHDFGQSIFAMEPPTKSQQLESEGVAADSAEGMSLNAPLYATVRAPLAVETHYESSGLYFRGGGFDLGGGIPTSSTASMRGAKQGQGPVARPLREACPRISVMAKARDSTDWESDSSQSAESIINSADF